MRSPHWAGNLLSGLRNKRDNPNYFPFMNKNMKQDMLQKHFQFFINHILIDCS